MKKLIVISIIITALSLGLASCGKTPLSPWIGDSANDVREYCEENGEAFSLSVSEEEKKLYDDTGYGVSALLDYFNVGEAMDIDFSFDGSPKEGDSTGRVEEIKVYVTDPDRQQMRNIIKSLTEKLGDPKDTVSDISATWYYDECKIDVDYDLGEAYPVSYGGELSYPDGETTVTIRKE